MPSSTFQPTRPWRPRLADGPKVRAVGQATGLDPIVAAVLVNRDVDTPQAASQFLQPSVDDLLDPFELTDMERAADRVARAIVGHEPILIYGDADMDGLSGTGLLVQFLRTLGCEPGVFVPNRAFDGYSFTKAGVDHVLEQGYHVVISVDNGMTSVDPVARLGAAGVDVIITDHHLPSDGEDPPPAFAIVNPRRRDCTYPNKALAGVGVAFKLACAVASRLHTRQQSSEGMRRFLGESLAWVAMGTISDVMPLRGENRVLVSRGLRAVPLSRHPGLAALCRVSNVSSVGGCSAEDVAFRLAPRINAASRMGRSDLAVDLVTSLDAERAQALASSLDQLNKDRQSAERALLEELEPHVEDTPPDEPVILASDSWSTGLLGLVAGRIARRRGLPAVLVSSANGDPAKGSCRSVPGFNVHAALGRCTDILEGHGGHPMAAGFSLLGENFAAFRERFLEHWRTERASGQSAEPLEYEGELPLAALTERLVRQVDRLAPFGEGNRRPILGAMGLVVLEARRMGGAGSHLQLQLGQDGTALRGVFFHHGDLADALGPGLLVDALFTPKLNHFRGRSTVELELIDLRPSTGSGPTAPT